MTFLATLILGSAAAWAPAPSTRRLRPLAASFAWPDFFGGDQPKKRTVGIVGASGNVGKLVAKRLLDSGSAVHAVVRNSESEGKLRQWLGDGDVKYFEADFTTDTAALKTALKGCDAVICCTGTTAFPTAAWAGGGVDAADVGGTVFNAWRDAKFDVAEALKALSTRGLNTPENVDGDGVCRVVNSIDATCKRVILMSSIGVTRRDEMPFKILNAAGVLSAKARGEAELIAKCKSGKCDYTIVRPGQLFGGPYDNNFYLGTLLALDKDSATRSVEIQRGDLVAGDTLRSALAEVLVQTLENPATLNSEFTVITVEGDAPDAEAIQGLLSNI